MLYLRGPAWGDLARGGATLKGDSMKTRALMCAVLGMFLALPAFAQQEWSGGLRVHVPFDFVVRDISMPAGDYRVAVNSNGHMFEIQNRNNPEFMAYMMSNDIRLKPDTYQARTKLTFVKEQNGRHVLHQICIQDDTHTHDIVHDKNVVELVASR